jgi:hypothetical protein
MRVQQVSVQLQPPATVAKTPDHMSVVLIRRELVPEDR